MAVRKPPTERQRRLGAELRKMREHAGLSLTDAAALHGTDKTTMSNTESGRFGVSQDRVRVWAANYACHDQDYVGALAGMARERRAGAKNWWDGYRDLLAAGLLDLAEMEHHAVALRTAQITHMPGLLQHEDYARAVFNEAVPPLPAEELERKVAFRVGRSRVLHHGDPPACTFLIHETALRMRFGAIAVAKRQLDHLLEQSDHPHVTVRVLPFAAGGFPSAGSSALYASGPVAQLDTVQKDTPTGAAFLHGETQLANYRAILCRMEERSLDHASSRDMIREVAKQL
ncbi:XRE family transcriptional regulator [Streptomyces sp. RKND-216]|uniref:Scr1 family TA system antitoxin-like transcriptional regulator n=1 Tax=Streptomyces sp. RKND-216 TaxID=2562581 RepID=UPI00109DB555|nr:Scr1 family TA system antitoxin-like transcriptional regulator [Streptomyces sp. RKND-216]THA25596.1 XRE family transcriptional regulator [Streptomyces sp. RKND-216]